MSTRKRNNNYGTDMDIVPKSDLPPQRKGKATAKHKTNLPFSRIRFNTFIYALSSLALFYIAFSVWRMFQWKTAAGGWMNLALGKSPASSGGQHHDSDIGGHAPYNGHSDRKPGRDNVEDRINALAEALGLSSKDLASAIADAVKSHVPPASLSSISAAEVTQSGSAVRILVGEDDGPEPGTGMADRLSALTGLDDPVME